MDLKVEGEDWLLNQMWKDVLSIEVGSTTAYGKRFGEQESELYFQCKIWGSRKGELERNYSGGYRQSCTSCF